MYKPESSFVCGNLRIYFLLTLLSCISCKWDIYNDRNCKRPKNKQINKQTKNHLISCLAFLKQTKKKKKKCSIKPGNLVCSSTVCYSLDHGLLESCEFCALVNSLWLKEQLTFSPPGGSTQVSVKFP